MSITSRGRVIVAGTLSSTDAVSNAGVIAGSGQVSGQLLNQSTGQVWVTAGHGMHEGLKVNQSHHVYVEDSNISGSYENPVDFEHESTSEWEVFDGASRAFHDSARARVSLVSTATTR